MNPAGGLALKLILTPMLVGAASLAGRRRGSAVGGWLIGMRGLLLGLFAFACFFLTPALLLPTGIAVAFGYAVGVALLVQGGSLAAGRRLGLA